MASTKFKAIFIGAIILLAGTTIGVVLFQQYQKSSYDVRIGFLEGDLHQLAFYVARENGYYAAENISFDSLSFANGGAVMVDFESPTRTIDMAYLGFAPAVYHRFNVETANITILSAVNVNGSALVVRDDPLINNASDLAGLTIAVPAFNNMQDFILSMILDLAGYTHADLADVQILSPADMVLAFQNGDIDGYVAWEPHCVKGLDVGGKILYKSSDVWADHPCCVIAAENTFLSQNPEIAEKVIRAHKRATEWIHDNPELAVALAMEKMNLTEEQAILAIANIGYVYMPDLIKMAEFVDKMVELNDEVSLDSPYIPSGLSATTFIDYFVDTSIVSNLA
ncbi:MAG: ABC transporter substrate-binding protein [Promethearchaeota archaeon]|nr:MAG: ABC transporter substrate-binding protein [Candidatus Lokiarchaeota archaeon]